jgi:hypothetical protein
MAAPGFGLVQGKSFQCGEIELGDRLVDIVQDDAPKPLVGHFHEPGGRADRHFPDEQQGGLLEEQGELASLARPRHLDPLDAVLGASDSGNGSGDAGSS